MYVENYFCRVSSRWWSTGVHRDLNAIAVQRTARFFKHIPKDAGGKHVTVKKRQRRDFLRFRAGQTDSRVHRDPLLTQKVLSRKTLLSNIFTVFVFVFLLFFPPFFFLGSIHRKCIFIQPRWRSHGLCEIRLLHCSIREVPSDHLEIITSIYCLL